MSATGERKKEGMVEEPSLTELSELPVGEGETDGPCTANDAAELLWEAGEAAECRHCFAGRTVFRLEGSGSEWRMGEKVMRLEEEVDALERLLLVLLVAGIVGKCGVEDKEGGSTDAATD